MSIVGPIPNDIQDGDPVDAVPVMANFNFIADEVNANAVSLSSFSIPGGSALIGYLQGATGSTSRTVASKLQEIISVKDFGAVGDFNPSTGVGTNNLAAIQAALDYACTLTEGCVIYFPAGSYYLGTGHVSNSNQVLLGSLTVANAAANVTIHGYGATVYQGAAGQAMRLSNCVNCKVLGLRMFGYTGGVLDATRGGDALIALQSCRNTAIQDCYLTNSLGDDIYVGGDGGCFFTKIIGNTLKERYGNNVRSSSGGTRSRWAVAVINSFSTQIHSNDIFGGIDCENNHDTEYIISTSIKLNNFLSGHVTAQSVIGTAYWYDEPTAASGGSVIDQSVHFSGSPGFIAGHSGLVTVSDNVVEQWTCAFATGSGYRVACKNNTGSMGVIICNDNSGTGVLYDVSGNTFDKPITGLSYIIAFNGGAIQQSIFRGNTLLGLGAPASYIFDDTGGGTDGGYNVFSDNNNLSSAALGIFGFTPSDLSPQTNNWFFQQISAGGPWINASISYAQRISKTKTGAFPTVTVTSAAQALDYRSLQCDTFVLAATGAGTLGQITNIDPGTYVLILYDAAGVTIKDSANFKTHGGADLVAGSSNSCTFCYSQGGIMRELISVLT